jgi:hypothetical protein
MATAGQVTSYDYQVHGGANGYQGNRAIIRLYGAVGTLAYVHVVPAGTRFPATQTRRPGCVCTSPSLSSPP